MAVNVNHMSPRSMTVAYLIYCDCKIHGWYREIDEIAKSIGVDENRVRAILIRKKWTDRVRCISQEWGYAKSNGAWHPRVIEATPPGRFNDHMGISA